METLLHNLSEVFAVSIIHSLWQCLLIWLGLRIILSGAVSFSAAAKHKISVAALYYATLWFVYTLFDQATHYSWVISRSASFTAQPHLPLINTLKHFAAAGNRYEITIDHFLPYISTAYVLGVVFHSLRLTSAWLQLRQLKQSIVANNKLQATVDKLAKQIKLKKQVLAGLSERIDVPCVAGYLKPVVMLPLSLGTYLSAKEIETILLHELSHVKRNDYLVNALQQIMSVLFFFNPFIYLINRLIDRHREDACDDMVVAETSEPLVYAQALLKIEQNSTVHLPLALAATGKKYHLLTRIERIMKSKKPITNMRHLVAAVTILIASSLSVAWFNPAIGSGKLSVRSIKPAIKAMFAATQDTTPTPAKLPAPPKNVPRAPKAPKSPGSNWVSTDGKNYYNNYGFSDPKLEAMGKEMEQYGKQMAEYYNGPAYKKMQDDMDKAGKEIDVYYNSPAYKKMQDDMEKSGKQMEEYYNGPAYKRIQTRMEEVGKQMEAYYNNPDLKKMNADMEKVGKEYGAAYGDGKDMEKVSKQMEAAGKRMSDYYDSPAFKKKATELQAKYHVPAVYSYQEKEQDPNVQAYLTELNSYKPQSVADAQEEMKRLGKQMGDHYNSPAIKDKQKQMKAAGDAMREAYNSPKIKQLQDEMKTLGEQMRNNNTNPEIKQLQDNMRTMGEQMRAYSNNPQMKETQQKMREMGKQMRSYNDDPKMKELKQKMKALGEQMHAYTQTDEFKKKRDEWAKDHADLATPPEPPAKN